MVIPDPQYSNNNIFIYNEVGHTVSKKTVFLMVI